MASDQAASGDEIPENGCIIAVRLRELDQMYNTWDPSPFHEKDLNREAEEHILSNAREVPKDAPLALVVYLDQPAGLPDEARVLRNAAQAHFARRSQAARRRLRQLFRRGRISLVIGLLCLAGGFLMGETILHLTGQASWAKVLRESLVIGGWVAMWRPLEIFLYDWWPILGERQVFDRLSRMAVRVVCAETHEPRTAGMTRAPVTDAVIEPHSAECRTAKEVFP